MRAVDIAIISLLLLECFYYVECAPGRRPPYTKNSICRQPCNQGHPHCRKPCPKCVGGPRNAICVPSITYTDIGNK
uniref:Putative 5.3 kDa protein n=1 Tax=Ixodes ricinus TaxID=34613 RepID=A0A0K8RM05_IXORI